MKTARVAAAILAAVVLASLAGCQTMGDLAQKFDPGQRPADKAFEQVVDQYLVKGKLYHGPETEMLLTVVPANWPVRQAWTERRAEAFAWTKEQKQKDLADQKAEYERNVVILASVFVPERKWNNWDKESNNWAVYLVNGQGQRLKPIDVRRIKKRSAIHEAIYPFWGNWDRLYLVKFPWKLPGGKDFLAPGQKDAQLLVAGPPGQIKLTLQVR